MKGTFFKKPLELILNIEGQTWKQGDTIEGNLLVKNHGPDSFSLKDYGLKLGFGAPKKGKALEILGEQEVEVGEVKGGEDIQQLFKFALDKHSPISEKSMGLYVVCGEGNMLELNVTPCDAITDLFVVFSNLLRFKVKSLKNKKDCLEANMVVPGGKEFSSIQQLKILVKMVEKDLDLEFKFKLKKISFEDGAISAKDEKLSVKKQLTPKEYLLYGAFNQDGVSKILSEVIEGVKVKPLV